MGRGIEKGEVGKCQGHCAGRGESGHEEEKGCQSPGMWRSSARHEDMAHGLFFWVRNVRGSGVVALLMSLYVLLTCIPNLKALPIVGMVRRPAQVHRVA